MKPEPVKRRENKMRKSQLSPLVHMIFSDCQPFMRKFIDRLVQEVATLPLTTRPDLLWFLRGAAWCFACRLVADHPLCKGGLTPTGRRYLNMFCRGYSTARRVVVIGAVDARWQHALRRAGVTNLDDTCAHLLFNAKN